MIRSLRTGITGLKSHQVKMDVTGNNIANVNTIGFKRSRALFSELLGQKMLDASGTEGAVAVNTSTIGFGVGVNSINQDWSQGGMENTNIVTDVAISGDGFFVVNNGKRDLITRDGSFIFDQDGQLVTNDGLRVQGYPIDTNGDIDTSDPQNIGVNFGIQSQPKYTESMTLAGNLSSDLEAGETVEISRTIYDESGSAHPVLITFTKSDTDTDAWNYDISYTGDDDPAPFPAATGSLAFNSEGNLVDNSPITMDWGTNAVASGAPISIDINDVTAYSSSTTVTIREQDGFAAGEIVGYNIDSQGMISLNFSNGIERQVFQLAIADITNPNGLENLGQNLYAANADSGEPIFGRAGSEIQAVVTSGSLEMSNVDLAQEFTDMIVAQRGYQANARVVTTSDELLQETVNLKR